MGFFSVVKRALFGKTPENRQEEQAEVQIELREQEVVLQKLDEALRMFESCQTVINNFRKNMEEFERSVYHENTVKEADRIDLPIKDMVRKLVLTKEHLEGMMPYLDEISRKSEMLRSDVFNGLISQRSDRVKGIGDPDKVWASITNDEERESMKTLFAGAEKILSATRTLETDIEELREVKYIIFNPDREWGLYNKNKSRSSYSSEELDSISAKTLNEQIIKMNNGIYKTIEVVTDLKNSINIVMAMEHEANEGFKHYKQLLQNRLY
jgi:hypothetical protein